MRGFYKGLLVSILVHGLVGAVVYAIPMNKLSKPEMISVDFTLVDQERVPEGLQGPGHGPGRRTVAKAKTDGITPGHTVKQGQQDRMETDVRTMESQTSRIAPAADPSESEHPLAAASDDLRQAPGAFSSSDGTPVAGTPGSGSPQGGIGGTSVASLSHSGSPGASGDVLGGGQGAILREIRDSIMKNVIYPDRARRMGWEGRVIVSFTVYEDGSIRDARIVQSSGTLVLDDAAKEALRKSTVRTQFAKRVQVVLPIEYKLK
jgi:periplasmic protein TonB